MKKSFRDYHLFKILNTYDFSAIPLDIHLGKYFRKNRSIGSKDRKVIAEKIYLLIRWMGLIDHHCHHSHEPRPEGRGMIWKGLRTPPKCGLELPGPKGPGFFFLDEWEERVQVLESLNIKKRLKDTSIPPHIRVSFPKYLFSLLLKHYGEEKAISLCLASNTPAPTTIRTNVLKTTRQTLFNKWKEKFSILLTKESVFGIQFEEKINFGALEEFKNGHFEVQDEASQLVANLVEAKPGDQILDYCAGSGGKTLAYAHKLQGKGQLYLHDIRPRPLQEAKRRLKRAGIENGQILTYDAAHKQNLLGKMDWVFVDVPCSGSGTFRRNPDLKWKFSKETLDRLVEEQRNIVKEALCYLSPKGKIVYATCSILSQENEEQIGYFEKKLGLDLTTRPFRSYPTEGGMDGFFGATLQWRKEG